MMQSDQRAIPAGPRRSRAAPLLALLLAAAGGPSRADDPAPAPRRALEINEFRLEGARQLAQAEVEDALAPYLGPGKALEDVEKARAALERAYSDRGFQAVTVAIPPQKVRDGVVTLQVTEGTVGRLRVRGARWFSLAEIKREAPSLAEGAVPNFNEIVRDIATLNQIPDRRVAPALRAGAAPDTVDVDLVVTDRLPLHGSVELNNRYSAGTSPQRLNGTLRYDNLWQQGHSFTFSFQTAPNRMADARIFSASYLARFLDAPWLTASVIGVLQNSDLSTLGALAVRGRGRTLGARVAFTLPGPAELFHSVTAGLDYKYYGKELEADPFGLPVDYALGSLQYAAAWAGSAAQTQAGATLSFSLRGLGAGDAAFDAKRYKASASFFHVRVEASRTQELFGGLQAYARVVGFFSHGPLVPAEQLTAGGLETVRGYLEATASGDRAGLGTFELRSPPLAPLLGERLAAWVDEVRLHLFAEGGRVALREPLPEQKWLFFLWSAGGGVRAKVLGHVSGDFNLGVPLRAEGTTQRYHPQLQFRLSGEF